MGAPIDLLGRRFGRLIVDQRSTRKGPRPGIYWLCVCDCGNVARVDGNGLRRGTTRSCGCFHRERVRAVGRRNAGAGHPQWNGGRYRHPSGYIVRKVDGKEVKEHRLVVQQILGRPLLPFENVHHINGAKDDNRPENLELWVTKQPKGQRPQDLLEWAREIIALYGAQSQGG